jgi:hypothetical protein
LAPGTPSGDQFDAVCQLPPSLLLKEYWAPSAVPFTVLFLEVRETIMGRVVLRTVWEENIEWNLFSVQFLIRPFLETYIGADARGGSPDNNMSNNNECTYSCIATRWLWNWLNSRPLKSENLNSEHASISHAKTIILHFKFGTVNTSSMKVKAFSAASSPERTRKDRHLELLFLMIGISIALAFGKN